MGALDDRAAVRELVENWALWRDSGDWERFATVWSDDGWMTATWFQGSAADFIERSKAGFQRGVRIWHFLGGISVDVEDDRAVAQTKMTISQRADIHGVEVDVVCTGRFFDFLRRESSGKWSMVRRQPIYEKDRVDTVAPGAELTLDPAALERYPGGYRHLAYLQEQMGYRIHPALPGLDGPEVKLLVEEGQSWLAGSPEPGVPLVSMTTNSNGSHG